MDLDYEIDFSKKAVIDRYQSIELSIVVNDKNRSNDLVKAIHHGLNQLIDFSKLKFGTSTEVRTRTVYANEQMIEFLSKADMWLPPEKGSELSGELFKMCAVRLMPTLPDYRIQLYIEVCSDMKFNRALYGLIDTV